MLARRLYRDYIKGTQPGALIPFQRGALCNLKPYVHGPGDR